jgi:hypothetical protein
MEIKMEQVTIDQSGKLLDYYDVVIRRNIDGVERICRFNWDFFKNGPDGDMLWLTEGNYSCDCNRGMKFDRTMNEEKEEIEGEDDPYPCGEDAYSIIKVITSSGKEIIITVDL